jgi:DnaK suppressor protein
LPDAYSSACCTSDIADAPAAKSTDHRFHRVGKSMRDVVTPKPEKDEMTQATLDTRRASLLALEQRLLHAASDLGYRDHESADDDAASDDTLEESLADNADHVVQEIHDALGRIDDGTYGLCAACGQPIPEERLDAIPYATLCLSDKHATEHDRGGALA